MPEELERRLQQEAAEKFPDDPERQRRYVYGTLRKTGWTPKRQPARRDTATGQRKSGGRYRAYTPAELQSMIRPERKKPARFKG